VAASNAKIVLDDIKDSIAAGIADGMTRVTERAVQYGQKLVAVPVEYGEGGVVTVRSSRGEPPRRETGELQDGIVAGDVEMGENSVSATVTSNARYSGELQGRYERPFMTGSGGTKPTVEEKFRKDAPKLLAAAVKRAIK
jgi:hypothetical protein